MNSPNKRCCPSCNNLQGNEPDGAVSCNNQLCPDCHSATPTTDAQCTCASFFTVRGVHKEGCPLFAATPTKTTDWRERFAEFKLMEYGKWKIGRAEAELFFADLLNSAAEVITADRYSDKEILKRNNRDALILLHFNDGMTRAAQILRAMAKDV